MSADAVDRVDRFKHPKVKGSVRVLLDVIAREIPEGGTMTRVLPLKDLAAAVGMNRRTIWTGLETLESIGAIRIVGGGRGSKASYELLALPGAGAPWALPLMTVLAPRSRATVATAPTLFDPPATDVATIEQQDRTPQKVGSFFLRWAANVGSFFLRWGANVGSHLRNVGSHVRPLVVDDARARDVHTFKERTHTVAAPPTPERAPRHRWHAWCDGAVHVPKDLHLEFLRKMGHLSGETDAERHAWLIAFYVRTCAALDAEEPIVENDWKFWRRLFAAEFTFAAQAPARAAPPRHEGGRFGSCPHDEQCASIPACRDRSLADAARERKSG